LSNQTLLYKTNANCGIRANNKFKKSIEIFFDAFVLHRVQLDIIMTLECILFGMGTSFTKLLNIGHTMSGEATGGMTYLGI
jgi:hypothetical protein